MNDEYLATGFTNVDRADNTSAYADCLSLLDSLPYYQSYKQKTYELLELSSNARVLDAGCGLGDDVFRMAEMISQDGIIVGIDASHKLIENARSNPRNTGLPTEFHIGDLKQLPFKNGSFSQCRVDRVLQHVPSPNIAIAELVRVLKQGGILVAYDNDWSTFSISSSNEAVTHVIETIWCESFTNSWIGRELQEYFLAAGLSEVKIYSSTSLVTDYKIADQVYNLQQTASRARQEGKISDNEMLQWLNELRDRTESNEFSVSLTGHTVVGKNIN